MDRMLSNLDRPVRPSMAGRGRFFQIVTVLLAVALLLPAVGSRAGSLSQGAPQAAGYSRTVESYEIPDVTLINQDREKVRLREFLDADRPVMVDFIYGTCTTICPVLSAGYANLQKKLGASGDVRLVSISIDPEYDTPEVMTDYLRRYRAKPGWDYLTGSREDIDKVMRAFNAYVPNKMSHYPLTLLRAPGEERWVRIYGLIGTAKLMAEYEQLLKK